MAVVLVGILGLVLALCLSICHILFDNYKKAVRSTIKEQERIIAHLRHRVNFLEKIRGDSVSGNV